MSDMAECLTRSRYPDMLDRLDICQGFFGHPWSVSGQIRSRALRSVLPVFIQKLTLGPSKPKDWVPFDKILYRLRRNEQGRLGYHPVGYQPITGLSSGMA